MRNGLPADGWDMPVVRRNGADLNQVKVLHHVDFDGADADVVSRSRSEIVASLVDVTKTYGQQRALDGITLDLYRGEVVALLGPNGAGKTTTVRLLLGLTSPTSGKASVFGCAPASGRVRARVGAMLQVGVSGVPGQLSVREHIDLFCSYYPNALPVDEVIAIAALSGIDRKRFSKLSGGEKQRVMFALALCGNPDLLFLDEPTVGMDIEARHRLWAQVRKLCAAGKTILLTTHYLEEADQLADRILVVRKGKLVAQGTSAQIKATQSFREIRCRTSLAFESVMNMPGVRSVRQEGSVTVVESDDSDVTVRALLQADPFVSDMQIATAALEGAFLALTGEDAPDVSQ
jgi:ABC-2 type transport system ATP-binding protein